MRPRESSRTGLIVCAPVGESTTRRGRVREGGGVELGDAQGQGTHHIPTRALLQYTRLFADDFESGADA